MNIRESSFQLCKSVWKSPSLSRLRELLESVNKTPREERHTNLDRSRFGYLARQQNVQLLGYLLVDQRRDEIERGPYPFPIPHLSNDEWRLLAAAHRQIQDLNRQCLAPLLSVLPRYDVALNPYNRFTYTEPSDVDDIDFLLPLDVRIMAQNFHGHPAFDIVLSTQDLVHDGLTPDQYAGPVIALTDRVKVGGVSNAPTDLVDMVLNASPGSPQRGAMLHIGSLMGIRDSLANLNQLIYQAILSDRLLLLNEENIIDARFYSNVVSDGASIEYQPDEMVLAQPSDLLLVHSAYGEHRMRRFARVEEVTVSVSQDFGESVSVELREVDENLNSFGGLIRSV